MHMETGERHIGTLLVALGTLLFGVGGQPLVNYLSGDVSLKSAVPSIISCVFGLALIFLGFFWRPRPDRYFSQVLGKWASSPVTYALIVGSFWIYMETLAVQRNMEIATLRNDQHSITQVLDRFVLPRQLSDGQIKSIGSFLQNFQPQEVAFEVVQGDQEASEYQNDIQRALEKAGWHIKEVKSALETSQSLSIDFRQTPEHSQVQSDFKHPKGDLLLQEAFGLAGVRLDGVSSGSSPTFTEDVMTIIVGHRHRDSYVQPCEPK